MTTPAPTHPLLPVRRPAVSPVLIVVVLATTGLGLLAAAAVQLAVTAGPALLATTVLVGAGWLLRTLTTAGAWPWIGCAVLAVAVGPLAGAVAAVWVLTRHTRGGTADEYPA